MKKKLLFITFLMLFCSTMFGQDHYVPVNTGQYSTSTTFISVISFDGVEQAKELELGVFCNDEVRASVRTSYNHIKKRYIATASVKGQSGDVFKFKVYDHSTNTEWSNDCTITYVDKNGITRVAQYVTFDSENGYGTSAQPCIINFNTPLHWTYNDSFENGMIVNSIVKIDNITQQNTNYELGVFCGGDVRGSAKLNSDGTVNTMVYGNAGDVFTFNLYDPNKGEGFDNNGELIFTEVNNITFNENGYFNLEVNFITAPYVAQIGTENYTSFEAALEAAVDYDEITLLEDVTLAVNPTVVSKDININVNGKTVTGTIELAHTGATVTCAEGAVTVTTSLADYNLVYDGVMYKLVAKVYVAQVGDVKYESIQEAVDAAQAGNEIVVIAAIDGEAVVVDKNVTISGSVTLNNVSINAVEGASELTVSGLSFAGNSWINSGAASKLTVTGVSANVTPSNATYTNSRSAFISLGRSEGKQLELIVTDCNIVANGGGDAILGWAAITNATLTGNTFGSETAYQTNSDCVKFMAIADGAVFNITGNTIYSNYNGIVFGQNTTRDNAYTVNVNTNNFYGGADHIWIEVSGSNTTHATIKATSDNKVNGNAFTAEDIKLHPNLNTFTSYAGVDVVLDVNGKVLGGTFKYVADGVIADGYEKAENNDGTYGIIKSISGKISYRAYVNDTETREGLGVDLENIVAKESVVVKLYDANGNLLTTTTYRAGAVEVPGYLTCNIVLWGNASSSWETTIHATELTVVNVPATIELIIDGQVLDTFENALGEGTNVDETEDYKALDCVLDAPVAKVGNTEYYNINNAIANWTNNTTLTLLADVTLSDVIQLKSEETHTLNLGTYTITAATGKNAIEIIPATYRYGKLTINADATNPGGITATDKHCIHYNNSSSNDLPTITINGGVFNGEYSIYCNKTTTPRGDSPKFVIDNGTFNGIVKITYGALYVNDGYFNAEVTCTGADDGFGQRLISGGTFKEWGFMTADAPNKFTVGTTWGTYNLGVYVDDNGYLVVGGDVITEEGTTFEASTANYSGWSSYLEYSSAATNGLYYTYVEEALADNNNNTTSSVNIYVSELDLTDTSYEGTLVITEDLTVTFPEGTTPAWTVASGEDGYEVGYTESVANGVVTRVYTLFTPVAKVGETYYATLEDAIAAAQAGQTVTLLEDITCEETIVIDKDVNIDGDNKTITSSARRAIQLETASKVNIEDLNIKSTAVRVSTNDIRGINLHTTAGGAELTLKNCTVDFTDESASDWAYAVNVTAINNCNLTINGGTYEGANAINVWGNGHTINIDGAVLTSLYKANDKYHGCCVRLECSGSTLVITNTTFNGEHAVAVSEATAGTNTVSAPLEEGNTAGNIDNTKVYVAKNGDVYYHSVTEAIAEAQSGATIKLLACDIDEYVNQECNKSITILGAAEWMEEGNVTTLTGGMYLGIDNSQCDPNTIVVKGITFEGKGLMIASQEYVTVENNIFNDITDNIAIAVIGKDIRAVAKNNTITNAAGVGIELRNMAAATITNNVVKNTGHNSVQATAVNADANVTITGNTFENWGTATNAQGQLEGRAVRVSGGANVLVNNNKMIKTNAPESFVKITKVTGQTAQAIDVDKNYWNGNNPLPLFETDGTNDPVSYIKGYYSDANLTNYIPLTASVAMIGTTYYQSFEAALNAVQNGETITLLGTTGSEISKEIEFTRAITFTITGTAPNYALPVVTFQNATVNIEDATILIPELDARQNAIINVIDSKVYDAGGNSIAKSYYNGAINISGTSEVYMMQVTTMGYINISGTAKLHATWQTNVYGNGLVTISGTSEFNTAALHLTAKDYENRDNTDAERVGKPAEIIVDGANFTVGKVYSSNGADYSYNSSHGINIGTIDGKFAILNVKNGGKVNYHMADGETANVGAGGTVNVNASTFKTQCRDTNGTVTLANNGTFNITGAAILAANVTGDGWFYMNSVAMTEATNLNGAKVRFASGTNNIVGSTIDNGFFQVGIGAYNGQDEKVDTENGVVVNVTNNAKIGAKDEPYAGWLGTGFYDTDAEKLAAMTDAKYVLNIENSIAEFGYIHVSNDGELNVSGNATVKAWYNNSDYSFYAGDLIINGTAKFDATDVLAIYTKVSCDNGTDNPGTLNINADTEYEAERHNGAISGTNFDIRKTGVVNVAANANLHIGEYTSIAADATMNIAGEATALGTITNNGVITLTTEAAELTTPELTTNVPTTNVPEYKVVYENGTYKVVAKVYVAEVNGVKYESLQEAVNVGGEVTILKDFVLTETVTIAADKTVTLDLNGKTISAGATFAVKAIVNNGTLTINGNGGTIDISASTTESIQVVDNYGTLTINGGTYKGALSNFSYAIRANHENSVTNIVGATITTHFGAVGINKGVTTITDGKFEVTSEAGGHALYVANAEVTINGGEFIPYANAYSYAVLTNDANAKVSITGGTFKKGLGDPCVKALSGNIILTGGTFSTDVNAYCHENYAAILGADNLWRVEQVIFVMETALANGWNWFSAYVDIDGADGLASIKESLGKNGLMVKDGETGKYIQYTASAETWNGTLTETSSVGMYMIKTSADIDEFIVEGSAKLDPSDEEMTMAISKGWNYIPYPLDVAQSITTALGFTPQHGDIIKGKGSGAVYMVGTNGQGWFEEFNMEPGQGYMYKSNATSTITFKYSYPTGGDKSSMLANVETIDYHWTVDAHKYANSMNMIAMVNVDGEMVKGGYEVAAFSNEGECRGTARPFYVEDMDAYLMILTIHGEEVENLTFRYYDIDTDTEYELNNVVTYSDNAIVGTIDNPYIFTMNILGIGENSIDNINIYPNPTTTDREINLNATFDKVEVYNALGVKVVEYQNVDTIDALETAGIYVIRVTDNNGDVKHCRLVVK